MKSCGLNQKICFFKQDFHLRVFEFLRFKGRLLKGACFEGLLHFYSVIMGVSFLLKDLINR